MFDYQTDEAQIINHLLLPLGSILHGATPLIMNRGNHETRGKYARAFKTYFDLPEQRFYHAQRYGDTFVIHLDTGEEKKTTMRCMPESSISMDTVENKVLG